MAVKLMEKMIVVNPVKIKHYYRKTGKIEIISARLRHFINDKVRVRIYKISPTEMKIIERKKEKYKDKNRRMRVSLMKRRKR